jgi:hypothetical protein
MVLDALSLMMDMFLESLMDAFCFLLAECRFFFIIVLIFRYLTNRLITIHGTDHFLVRNEITNRPALEKKPRLASACSA